MQELEKILEEIKQKAIELKNTHWENDEMHLTGKGVEAMCVQAERIIRKHMNSDWISIRQALPESGEKVLVYRKNGEIDTASLYNRDNHMWIVGSMCGVSTDVIVWQPLPEPYKPEKEANKKCEK